MLDIIDNCIHRVEKKGYPIPRNSGYPTSAWGAYLPGDEPTTICEITNHDCTEFDITTCPNFENINKTCSYCYNNLLKNCIYKNLNNSELYCKNLNDKIEEPIDPTEIKIINMINNITNLNLLDVEDIEFHSLKLGPEKINILKNEIMKNFNIELDFDSEEAYSWDYIIDIINRIKRVMNESIP